MPVLRDKGKRQKLRESLYQRLAGEGVGIADATRDLRRVLGLSQQEFAHKVGMSLSTLRKIEQEHGNLTLETLDRIFGKFHLRLVVKSRAENEAAAE